MSEPNPTDTTRGVDRTLAEWASALAAGDLTTLVGLVTEDAEFWSHGAAPLVGRDAVKAAFRPFLEKYKLTQGFEIRERCLGTDWCLLCGVETNVLEAHEGGERREIRQRAFSLLRREADGRWRFARGMTNQGPDESRG
jgi:uncharacterized protein (TIGR02246 family)